MVCYPTQTLNQRMEYWQQDKFKESCGFCPHKKPNIQDTYQYMSTAGNTGRYPFMNVGATYDGDFGNDFLYDSVTTDQNGFVAAPKTYLQFGLVAADAGDAGQFPPWTNGTGAMYFKFREPVMAEPSIIILLEQVARQ